MRLLITGAEGMLGQDCVIAARRAGHEVTELTLADVDITQRALVDDFVGAADPDVVINCAAWTDVDGAEENLEAATAVNGAGAGNVARAATASGAWMIQLSTDYVFDGAKREPYVESDPAGPKSAYGQSKLAGERRVAEYAPGRHTIVRSSWLFGARGPCFPTTILRLASERDELNVVDDQVGCPTFTGHLAEALVELGARETPPTGIVHLAGGGYGSWYEFAQEIVARSGLSCAVKPCTTEEMRRPAPRPAYSVLGTERDDELPVLPVLPHWRQGLAEYFAETTRTVRAS